ncbi:MAG: hypothetical protein KDC05_17075, partial [Bacteroidales bacterium]|nr:hypothetical protein [Bacteroidales bacterium]
MLSNWNIYKPLPFSLIRFGFTLLFTVILMIGGWSQNITKVEYFLDTDPGYGAGTDVPVTPSPDLNNININVDLSGLDDGIHKLFVRAKDENGVWSHSPHHTFCKIAIQAPLYDLTKVEYFIDTDPGPGNGTDVPVTPGPILSNLNFSIDLTGLPDGLHHLFIRTKNNQGIWSLTTGKIFYKQSYAAFNSSITDVEYFFDTDPGFGNGTSIPVTPSADITVSDYVIDITSLPDGLHKLFVRAKDEAGVWSITNFRNFYKKQLTASLQNIV